MAEGQERDDRRTGSPEFTPDATDQADRVSECCGAPRDTRYVTDFCSRCHEHATFTTEEA